MSKLSTPLEDELVLSSGISLLKESAQGLLESPPRPFFLGVGAYHAEQHGCASRRFLDWPRGCVKALPAPPHLLSGSAVYVCAARGGASAVGCTGVAVCCSQGEGTCAALRVALPPGALPLTPPVTLLAYPCTPQLCLTNAGFHKPHLPFYFPSEFGDLYPVEEVQPPKYPDPPDGMPLAAWHEGNFNNHWNKPCNDTRPFRRVCGCLAWA